MEARGLKDNVKVMGSMEEIVKEKGTRREELRRTRSSPAQPTLPPPCSVSFRCPAPARLTTSRPSPALRSTDLRTPPQPSRRPTSPRSPWFPRAPARPSGQRPAPAPWRRPAGPRAHHLPADSSSPASPPPRVRAPPGCRCSVYRAPAQLHPPPHLLARPTTAPRASLVHYAAISQAASSPATPGRQLALRAHFFAPTQLPIFGPTRPDSALFNAQ
nr:vegetative cell wall protein gp1-like [Lolium perenne]